MPVSGPPPSVGDVLDAGAGKKHAAQNQFPAEGIKSLPQRLEALLNANPTVRYTAEEAAKALGDDYRKSHYTLLRRMARHGKARKVGRGIFAALASKKNGKK
jgi:hypothetical protein